MNDILLTKSQKEIMEVFFSYSPSKIIFNKKERNKLWKIASAKENLDINSIKLKCPALAHQIEKSYNANSNIQSAVFSECVYAQTLANMMGFDIFINCFEDYQFIPNNILLLLKSHNLNVNSSGRTR